jgi:hypothetical protein
MAHPGAARFGNASLGGEAKLRRPWSEAVAFRQLLLRSGNIPATFAGKGVGNRTGAAI